MWVRSLGWEDLLEEGMATHSSILASRVPWTADPRRLQSLGVTESQTLLKRLSTESEWLLSKDTFVQQVAIELLLYLKSCAWNSW